MIWFFKKRVMEDIVVSRTLMERKTGVEGMIFGLPIRKSL